MTATTRTVADIRAAVAARDPQTRDDFTVLLDEIDRLQKRVVEMDRMNDQTMGERDAMHDVADKLAYSIAPIEVLGEHSSDNNPWENALDHVTSAAQVDELRQQRDQARGLAAAWMEDDARRDDETSPWERAVDGLNALVDAGIGFHIEPDGHIANPAGDEHIEWDTATARWTLTHDEEGDA